VGEFLGLLLQFQRDGALRAGHRRRAVRRGALKAAVALREEIGDGDADVREGEERDVGLRP
jgi:hypothetical protein